MLLKTDEKHGVTETKGCTLKEKNVFLPVLTKLYTKTVNTSSETRHKNTSQYKQYIASKKVTH